MRRKISSVAGFIELALASEILHAVGHGVETAEHTARAVGRAGERVVRDVRFDAGAFGDEAVNAVQEAAAAGHDDAVFRDIRHQMPF